MISSALRKVVGRIFNAGEDWHRSTLGVNRSDWAKRSETRPRGSLA